MSAMGVAVEKARFRNAPKCGVGNVHKLEIFVHTAS